MSELSRLRWRCRRGIKEMDLVFQGFLEQCYPQLNPEQKVLFEKFLDETDLDILDWILERRQPSNPDYQPLLQLCRQLKSR